MKQTLEKIKKTIDILAATAVAFAGVWGLDVAETTEATETSLISAITTPEFFIQEKNSYPAAPPLSNLFP